jgi:hypothetical protein
VLRGKLYERAVHNVLSKGGTYDLTALGEEQVGDGSSFTTTGPVVRFRKISDISRVQNGAYHFPTIDNLESIDSFVVSAGTLYLLQITVARMHPVKMRGLTDITNHLASLGCIATPVLVFVVPADMSGHYEKQQLTTVQGAVAKCVPERLQSMKQFSCGVSLAK